MSHYKGLAEEAAQAIHRMEPNAFVYVRQRFFRRSWYVEVVRNGKRYEYEDIYHYGLESCLLTTFGAGREENG